MMNNKILRKIILTTILIFIAIFATSIKVNAATTTEKVSKAKYVGLTNESGGSIGSNGIRFNLRDLDSKKWLNCIAKGGHLWNTQARPTYKISNIYLVNAYAEDNPNGFSEDDVSDDLKKKSYFATGKINYTTYKPSNGGGTPTYLLAYILSTNPDGGSHSRRNIQLALWASGINSGSKIKKTELYKEAEAYNTYMELFDKLKEPKGSSEDNVTEVNNIMGPFVNTYASVGGKYKFGQIQEAYFMADGKQILLADIATGKVAEFVDKDGKTLTIETGLDSNTVTSKCTGYPKSGQEFYIKLNSDELKNAEKLTLHFKFNHIIASGYYAKLEGRQGGQTAQKLAICGGKRVPVTYEITYELDREPEKPKLEIEGNVWEDGKLGKDMTPDGLMYIQENGDKVLPNITVRLYDKDNKLCATTVTDSTGKYSFKNLEFGEYYVEFEYDGLSYAPTKKGVQGANNSKADETEAGRTAFNNKFNEISKDTATSTTGEKTSLAYNYTEGTTNPFKLAESELKRFDSNGNPLYKMQAKTDLIDAKFEGATEDQKVDNINLGVVIRYESDFILMSDMIKAEVFFDGKLEKETQYGIRDQNKINEILLDPDKLAAHRSQVYNVDISEDDIKNGVELYLTYMTVIQNTSERAAGMIKEIVERVDKELSIEKAWIDGGTELRCATLEANTYNIIYITGMEVIDPVLTGNTVTIYMRFKIDTKKAFEGVKPGEGVEKVTTSEISIYSFNNQANVSNDYNKDIATSFEKAKYINGAIDKDSQPRNGVHRNGTTFEDDTSNSPRVYLKLVRKKNIGGLVWEDDGDGIRQDDEKLIKGITVELYNTSNMDKPVRATATGEDGRYLFEDISNGEYIVRFKYGDTDMTAKLLGKGGENQKSYNGHDFMNTAYNPSINRGSDAKDNSDRRNSVQAYSSLITSSKYKILTSPYNDPDNNNAIQELISNTWMHADTATMTVGEDHDNTVRQNTDFGLLEKEESKIKVEKRVSAIRILDSNGLEKVAITIKPGEIPEGKGLELIKQIPNKENPIQYNIELGTELLTGATIEIEYEIKVINESNIEVSVTKLLEYIGNSSTYNTENTEWKEISKNDISKVLSSEIVDTLDNNVILEYANEIKLAAKEEITKKIVLSGSFSSTDKEIEYTNIAEVGEYSVTTDGRVNRTMEPANKNNAEEDIDNAEPVTINDATGEERIYYILGTVVLLMIIVGVVYIRKTVLQKKTDK